LLTINELKDRLIQEYDADTLLEILDIDAEEIMEAFHDKIEARFDVLLEELDIDEE
jgi:hypothetical protein